MAVPRNRHSNSRKNKRRAHDAKKPINAISCPNCNKMRLSHRMCPGCGHYRGRSVIQEEQLS